MEENLGIFLKNVTDISGKLLDNFGNEGRVSRAFNGLLWTEVKDIEKFYDISREIYFQTFLGNFREDFCSRKDY